MDTVSYWLSRLEPLIRADATGEIIVVLANRTGTEGDATYAGTSAVFGIHDGEVEVYGLLGRGERALLVVDTTMEPYARLVSRAAVTTSTKDTDASEPEAKESSTGAESRLTRHDESRSGHDTTSSRASTGTGENT
jgi:protein N-terminal amidase